MKFQSAVSLILLTLFSFACKKTPNSQSNTDNGKDREALLIHYADSIILPDYINFEITADTFHQKVNDFIATPTPSNLVDLRLAWTKAYIKWQTVELFDFGPAEYNTLRNFYNIYPADTIGITSNITNPNSNLDVPAAYAQQGFPAFDYLLNGVAKNDASTINYYTHATLGTQRCAYLKRLSERMDMLLKSVISDWKGTYRQTFISKTGLDLNASTSLMVNGFVLHYERFIRSGKIGIPSGVMVNGVKAPEKVEAFYKNDISLKLTQSAHQAYTDFFNGRSYYTHTEGPSIKTYLDALDAKDPISGQQLSQIINAQLSLITSQLNGLLPSFYQQITTNNTAMNDVFNSMQTLVRLLKVDMTSAMSITITYTDNDGD